MIPDATIDEIRSKADIVAVIGEHVQLRKAGRSFKGLCPFHGEKTPSFNVVPDKGIFHCFGCKKTGDVFTFVMELQGRSFVEAAETLAERCGIRIEQKEDSPELRRMRSERTAMLDLNKVAAALFREVLADPKRGAPGRAYLDKRGIDQATRDRFQLGYAPADWRTLTDHLRAKRCDLDLAVRLGLAGTQPGSPPASSTACRGSSRPSPTAIRRRSTSTASRARSTRRASSCTGWPRRARRWRRRSAPSSSRATST
jgi:DNA primase